LRFVLTQFITAEKSYRKRLPPRLSLGYVIQSHLLVSCGTSCITLFPALKNGNHQYSFLSEEKDESYSIRFSPDNQFIVAGGGDGDIRVYNSTTGKMAFHLVAEERYPVTCLRFRPNTSYTTTKNILIASSE
jgi:WD40 repeat protein